MAKEHGTNLNVFFLKILSKIFLATAPDPAQIITIGQVGSFGSLK